MTVYESGRPPATPIGQIGALVRDDDGGSVVYVNGLATFCFNAGDEVGRRLAAVQLVETEIARPSQVGSGFAVTGEYAVALAVRVRR
jgi:hypothetical protein